MRVDIGMIDASYEFHLGRSKGVVMRELDFELKSATLVGRLLRAYDLCGPARFVVLADKCS